MKRELRSTDYLPNTALPIEYATYRHNVYLPHNGFIYGKAVNEPILPEDETNIGEQFHRLYPEEPAFYSNKHSIRANYFTRTHKLHREIIRQNNGIEVLSDLLNLYDDCFEWEHQINKELVTEKALTLCKRYGMLRWQEELDDQVLVSSNKGYSDGNTIFRYFEAGPYVSRYIRDTEGQNSILFRFDVQEIYDVVKLLQTLYLAWRVLMWNEAKMEKRKLDKLIDFRMGAFNSDQSFEHGRYEYEKLIQHESEHLLSQTIITFTHEKPVVIAGYRDPLDAAIGCMLGIIGKGQDGLEQRSVGECQRCGAHYIKQHGSLKFCPDCRLPTVRVQAYREREKAKEAKESGTYVQESKQ